MHGYYFFLVDDGSATIACCCWHSSDPSEDRRESYDLGQLVTVQGKISVFREQRQLTVDQICIQAHQLIKIYQCVDALHEQSRDNMQSCVSPTGGDNSDQLCFGRRAYYCWECKQITGNQETKKTISGKLEVICQASKLQKTLQLRKIRVTMVIINTWYCSNNISQRLCHPCSTHLPPV